MSALFKICARVARSDGKISLDGSSVTFVDPLGLAVLGALLGPRRNREQELVWLDCALASYLSRMNLFEICPLEGVYVRDQGRLDRRKSLVELTYLDLESEIDQTAQRLALALMGHGGVAEGADEGFDVVRRRDPLQYALSELLLNSLTHARREGHHGAGVWVAAQYYPAADLVRIAVVDNGCGMYATLKDHPSLKTRDHAGAIQAALEPRISCNRDLAPMAPSHNQGVGLTVTHKIARQASGRISIVSGDSLFRGGHVLPMGEPAFWQGVAIEFTCRRTALAQVNIGQMMPKIDAPPVKLRFDPPE